MTESVENGSNGSHRRLDVYVLGQVIAVVIIGFVMAIGVIVVIANYNSVIVVVVAAIVGPKELFGGVTIII